jgi:hypothetical protein
MRARKALGVLGAALAAFAVSVGVSAAGSLTAGPLVQVSGASPIAACTADAGQSGTVYVGSEVEPWIDVNPTNAQNLVGTWQQDRWSNGGARAHGYAASFDGGDSWTTGLIPGLTKCSGGPYDRATDPWVTFAPNGHLYQLALVFNDSNFDHGLLASKSTDGGLTWGAPQFVIRDTDGNVFNDKQTITADPTNANFVYAVWDRLVFPQSERANDRAFVSFGGRGPTWFARTTNGGTSWEPARKIFDAGQESQTIGNQIVVSNGTLVNGMNLIYYFRNNKGVRGSNVAVIRSTDKGATWSQKATIVSKLGTIEIHDPETGDYIRTGDIIPDFAVDPTNGHVYAAWQDARFNGGRADAIAVSRSTDGGLTWSAPIKVNATPTNIAIGNQQAFTPSVHVASNGTVAVTYYDFRHNTPAASLLTDYFVVHCHSACASASSWGGEVRLTDNSFDMRSAPNAGGFFTGDYEGLTASGATFDAFWSMPHAADSSSVFFRRAAP